MSWFFKEAYIVPESNSSKGLMNNKLNCIMLIDDDLPFCFLTEILINKQKVCKKVIKMHSAAAALNYLSSEASLNGGIALPDIIFLDIVMPGLSGWEFLEKYEIIKANLSKEPFVYILSAFTLEKHFLRLAKVENVSGICEKPLTKEILNDIVAKCIANNDNMNKSLRS